MIFIISHANQNLAKTIQILHLQFVRYNTRDLQATSAPAHLADDVFNVSIDFLINGNTDVKAASTLKDAELLQQFRAVEQMDEEDKNTVKKLIDAFITKRKIQQMAL